MRAAVNDISQTIKPGETPVQFAERVQKMIAARAGIKAVPWDGYMKYWKPSKRFIEKQQEIVAQQLSAAFDDTLEDSIGLPSNELDTVVEQNTGENSEVEADEKGAGMMRTAGVGSLGRRNQHMGLSAALHGLQRSQEVH